MINNEKEQLLSFIRENNSNKPLVSNTLMQALQYTTDSMKAKALLNEMLEGNLGGLNQETLSFIIRFLEKKGFIKNIGKEEQNNYLEDNNIENTDLEELQELRHSYKILIAENRKLQENLERLVKENQFLKETVFTLDKNDLIEIPDEDICELYVKYVTEGIKEYKKAFVINEIIPKTYYKIKRREK